MIYLLASIGIVLSVYMAWIQQHTAQENHACDLFDRVSCTRVARSSHAKTFGIPNGILGIGFYLTVAVVWYLGFSFAVQILAVMGLAMTFYLSYQLLKLRMVCLICVGIHIVDIWLFTTVFWEYLR